MGFAEGATMALLHPRKEWWPQRPMIAIGGLKFARLLVVGTTFVAAAAANGSGIQPIGVLMLIAGGLITLAMVEGLRWILEMLVWEAQRLERADNDEAEQAQRKELVESLTR